MLHNMKQKVMEHATELRLLADSIRAAREEKGITQEKLAEYLDITPTHVRNLESGRREPSIKVLITLCQILDISFDRVVKAEARPVSSATERIVSYLESAFSEEERNGIADIFEAAAKKRLNQ